MTDIETLKLELKDLNILYEKTRNKVTKAELADKIAQKKKEIKAFNEPKLEKNIVPSRNVTPRMDHQESAQNSTTVSGFNSFKITL